VTSTSKPDRWIAGAALTAVVLALLFGWLGYRAGDRDARKECLVIRGGPLGD
jgi:hypothetical protein